MQNEDCGPEKASQIALRICSREVGEEVNIACDFSESGYLQVSMPFGRDLLLVKRSRFTDDFSAFQIGERQELVLIKSPPGNISPPEGLFCQFFS